VRIVKNVPTVGGRIMTEEATRPKMRSGKRGLVLSQEAFAKLDRADLGSEEK